MDSHEYNRSMQRDGKTSVPEQAMERSKIILATKVVLYLVTEVALGAAVLCRTVELVMVSERKKGERDWIEY